MLIAILKLLGMLLALAIVVGIVVTLVVIAIAVVRMMVVTATQWRDVISFDRWQEVIITIGRNKLRTALTLISVSWGIFVLVFLLGLGRGLDHGARHEFARDATNGVWITANKTSEAYGGYDVGRRLSFDNRDYERAKNVKGLGNLGGQFFMFGSRFGGNSLLTKRGGKASAFQVNAVHPTAWALETHEMIGGRFLDWNDIAQKRKSAVVGAPVRDYLFAAGEDPIGQWIEVAGVPFQIVGVFRNDGGAEQERQIYIPVSTAQLAFNGADHLGMIEFTVGDASPEETQQIVDQVVAQLSERHDFSPGDKQAVRVMNNVEQFQRFSKMFFMMSMFVLVIGLGTLAAGVVGVSNIMMIAVKERTKEIGIRKAIGATPNSIVFMVIQEAVFLTGIAGLLGLAAGVGLLSVVGNANLTAFIRDPSIDLKMGVAATMFLVFAGALAGYFPARAAARINPIHALRDE
ncbi:MAG TPA: ABC transporter permease [Kofleriaceae bacterium]|nr:ABC transporter permease [Kofleriaceae bacterium]